MSSYICTVSDAYKAPVVKNYYQGSLEEYLNNQLKKPMRIFKKEHAPLWGFYSVKEDYEHNIYHGGIRRTKRNFTKVNALVLDYDGGMTMNEVHEQLQNYQHWGYTTYNHMKTGVEKFRVILPLVHPVDTELISTDYTLEVLLDYFKDVDESTFDVGRFFYLPSCTSYRDYEWWFNDGDTFDFMSEFKTKIGKQRIRHSFNKYTYKEKQKSSRYNESLGYANNYFKKAVEEKVKQELSELNFWVRGTGMVHRTLCKKNAQLAHNGFDQYERMSILMEFAVDGKGCKEIEDIVNSKWYP